MTPHPGLLFHSDRGGQYLSASVQPPSEALLFHKIGLDGNAMYTAVDQQVSRW